MSFNFFTQSCQKMMIVCVCLFLLQKKVLLFFLSRTESDIFIYVFLTDKKTVMQKKTKKKEQAVRKYHFWKPLIYTHKTHTRV